MTPPSARDGPLRQRLRARRLRRRLRGRPDWRAPPRAPSRGPHGPPQSRSPRRRRAPIPTPATARASSPRCPTRSFAPVCEFTLPPPGGYAAGLAFLPGEPAEARRDGGSRADRGAEGLAVLGWRDVPHDATSAANGARAVMPRLAQLVVPRATGDPGIDLDRQGVLPAQARRARDRARTSPACRSATIVYKGMLTALQLEPFFPDLSDPRYASRARARALPVLHQHVPVLAAGPPVPVHRPQRRDQHHPRQPELDARPRGDAGLRRPRHRRRRARDRAAAAAAATQPARATRRASTRAWSCCTWAAARCRTRC